MAPVTKKNDAAVKTAAKTAKAVKQTSQIRKKVKRTSTKFITPPTKKISHPRKYPRKAVSRLNRYDEFKIIKHPVSTETAMKKIEEINTLVFMVDLKANKKQIREAVIKRVGTNVKPIKVNTLILPNGRKKAYVKLDASCDALEIANKLGCI
eukprot:GHVN01102359.1.p1 GENE.GHVN01102359.1~~GHVN01102359.1.p1  ORF type:complete len:178 (-),score=33.81 GHVN01102359.1:138-593(-)